MEQVDDRRRTRYIAESILYLKRVNPELPECPQKQEMEPTSLEIEFPVLDNTLRIVQVPRAVV